MISFAPRQAIAAVICTASLLCTTALAQAQEAPDIEPPSRQPPIPTLPPPGAPAIATPDGNALPSVLAILAHPDDEITIAPVLSRIARTGGEVTLVFATSGDAGPGLSGLEPGNALAELRESEARCASFALRLPQPILWRFGDGTLAQEPHEPDSPAQEMREHIRSLIAVQQPQVIMTWGPDGGYGHADHRMISNVVTEIVQMMDEPRPDLLYSVFPSDSDEPLPGFEQWATIHPSLVTDRIQYDFADLEATRLAIDCYHSQFGEQERSVLPSILHHQLWRGTVSFRLAFERQ